jgi:hypothetical protein
MTVLRGGNDHSAATRILHAHNFAFLPPARGWLCLTGEQDERKLDFTPPRLFRRTRTTGRR